MILLLVFYWMKRSQLAFLIRLERDPKGNRVKHPKGKHIKIRGLVFDKCEHPNKETSSIYNRIRGGMANEILVSYMP